MSSAITPAEDANESLHGFFARRITRAETDRHLVASFNDRCPVPTPEPLGRLIADRPTSGRSSTVCPAVGGSGFLSVFAPTPDDQATCDNHSKATRTRWTLARPVGAVVVLIA